MNTLVVFWALLASVLAEHVVEMLAEETEARPGATSDGPQPPSRARGPPKSRVRTPGRWHTSRPPSTEVTQSTQQHHRRRPGSTRPILDRHQPIEYNVRREHHRVTSQRILLIAEREIP